MDTYEVSAWTGDDTREFTDPDSPDRHEPNWDCGCCPKVCRRRKCDEPAVGGNTEGDYCLKHRAFRRMQRNARKAGKQIPSYAILESLIPDGMRCVTCDREMHWAASDGRSDMATLQHDRDGSLRLICMRCNIQHHFMPGDTFYERAHGAKKYCAMCKQTKPMDAFSRSTRYVSGRLSNCRECCAKRWAKWSRTGRSA